MIPYLFRRREKRASSTDAAQLDGWAWHFWKVSMMIVKDPEALFLQIRLSIPLVRILFLFVSGWSFLSFDYSGELSHTSSAEEGHAVLLAHKIVASRMMVHGFDGWRP